MIAEVQQHLGEGRVRTVSMVPTDGMVRGMKVIDTGGPITMPVGEGTLGRVLNVIGQPVDNLGDVKHTERYPIHRHAPTFDEQSTELQMFETGIKVIDLIQPFRPRWQDWSIWWSRRGQDSYRDGVDQQHRESRVRVSQFSPASANARAKETTCCVRWSSRRLSILATHLISTCKTPASLT